METNLTLSQIAERILYHKGSPYSLDNYPMFRDIIDSKHRRKLMKSGRQVSKTVTLAASMLTKKVIYPQHRTIYCNASENQTRAFSTDKLDDFLKYSPLVQQILMKDKSVINNVYNKRFSNASHILLSYISDSGDRVRGNSADELELDEIQDMLYDAIIDVEECLTAADKPSTLYAGTSKTSSNVLEFFWSQSSMKEWVIKCGHCGSYNLPDIKNIGKQGIICKKCGGDINTFDGFWYATATEEAEKNNRVKFDGYHIPQIILPMHCLNEEKWSALLNKYETYPENKFLNEVMGVPSGVGSALITEDLLRAMCIDHLEMVPMRTQGNSNGAGAFIAGIDWGGGGQDGTSRTVLVILATYPNAKKAVMVYGKIFSGADHDAAIEEIAQIIMRMRVHMVFGDKGGGATAMSRLQNILAKNCGTNTPIRCVPVQYASQAKPFNYNESGKFYTVDRTSIIDGLILDIKNGLVKSGRWEDFQPFAEDFLNVEENMTSGTIPKRIWARNPAKSDDSLHAFVFAWFGYRIVTHQLSNFYKV